MSIAGFLNPCDNDVYQRLLTLQEQYQECREIIEEVDNKNEKLFIKRKPIPINKIQSKSPLDPEQLAYCMKQVILRQGGLCHTETLVEFVQKFWPSARHSDGRFLSKEEIKNEILFVLRDRREIFFEESIGWGADCEEGEIANKTEVVPLVEKMVQIIEDEDCSCRANVILDRVEREWIPPKYKGQQASVENIREMANIILETNPKFTYDTKNPVRYCVPLTKKVRRTAAIEAENAAKKKEEESSESEAEISHPLEPPEGFICACGATTPGKTATAKWRLDSNGVFKCISCYGKNKRYNPKNSRKKKKSAEKSSGNSTSDPSDPGPWIQCDRCHAWVMAYTDNIRDISVYDDSNPNHLDYFCPDCRAVKSAEAPQRKSSRRRASRKE